MAPDDAVDAAIERWVDRVELVTTRLDRCDVTVTHSARAFEVELVMTLVGIPITVTHDRFRERAHENVYVAVADAFRAALHQMRERFAIGIQPVRRFA